MSEKLEKPEEQVNKLMKWLLSIEEVIQDEPEVINKIIKRVEEHINEAKDNNEEDWEENYKYEISLIKHLKQMSE